MPRSISEVLGMLACCIDCGDVRYVPRDTPDTRHWRCWTCVRRYEENDVAERDDEGNRVCAACRKRLARLNFGPYCFACELAGVGREPELTEQDLKRLQREEAAQERRERGVRAAQMRLDGASWKEIAEACGYGSTPAAIGAAKRYGGFDPRAARPAPRAHAERDAKIRADYAAGGVSYRALAERYGLTYYRVSLILNGERATAAAR